jgi:CrcB protein
MTMGGIAAVFFGGGLGALCRWALTLAGGRALAAAGCERDAVAVATLVINLAGCLAMGIAYGVFARTTPNPALRLLVATGFLGGFTTFSSYALEAVTAFREGRPQAAIAIALASNIGGIFLVALGIAIGDAAVRTFQA